MASFSSFSFAEVEDVAQEKQEDPTISIDYKVWWQDHETIGKRYVSAQNNLLKLTAHTQSGFIPNLSIQIGKAESNLFAYTNTDIRAFYVYDFSENLSFDYGVGLSMRYDALHGKQDDPASLKWEAFDPHLAIGATYDISGLEGLSVFTGLEKRFNSDNNGFSGGTTTEIGARYTFVDKGYRSITAEIGYRRDIQDNKFSVTKVVEPEEPTDPPKRTGESTTTTEIENRRMISDGFYMGVKISF